MEGFLPWYWCVFWFILSIPVVAYGILRIGKIVEDMPESKSLLAVSGAFMFILSSLKLPSTVGSCSHPTGNGLGTILFGPAIVSVLATITLIFQALLLAHGGLTTLGANIFSMGIMGPLIAWLVYKTFLKSGFSLKIGVFLAAFLADIVTYIVTAMQLSLAFPLPTFTDVFVKFLIIFAYTQLPLAIAEGLITIVIWNSLMELKPDILKKLNTLKS